MPAVRSSSGDDHGPTQYYDLTTPSPETSPTYSTLLTTPSPPSTTCTCPITPSRDSECAASGKKRARVRRAKNQDHIPRPRNAFIIFRSHYINFLRSKASGDGLDKDQTYPVEDEDLFMQPQKDTKKPQSSTSPEYQQNELSKVAAKVWNNMDAEARKPYAEEARKEKEWHKSMYPDYVYRAPSVGGDKMKRFKIKVKMGDPSQDRKCPDRKRDSASSSSSGTNARAPPSPGQQEPHYSDVPPESSSLVPSNTNVQLVDFPPPQWLQENPSQHYDQQYLPQSVAAEQEFVPTECIPPLELCPSIPIKPECQKEVVMEITECAPQSTYAVDLSPRSLLAYEQYQAKNVLSVLYPEAFVAPPSTDLSGYEYGVTDFATPLAGSGSDEGLPTVSSPSFLTAFATPTTLFEIAESTNPFPDSASFANIPYPSFTVTPSDPFSPSAILPSSAQNPNFDWDFSTSSVFQLETIMDKFMPLDLEVDVPDFNLQLGDYGVMDVQMTDDLAAWAGYA